MQPRLFLGSLILAALPAAAFASPVTYTYTANPFSGVLCSNPSPCPTSVSLTFSLTFSSLLAPNLDGISAASSPTPLSFTASDGDVIFTNNTPGLDEGDTFGTDAEANIEGWGVTFSPQDGVGLSIFSSGTEDTVEYIDLPIYWQAENDNDPGTWTISSPPSSATPEPSTLWLLGTGVTALAAAARRRLRPARTAVTS